jgi:transmembrane sensor
MSGAATPVLADNGHTMVADIPEHPALFLTGVDSEAHAWLTRFAARDVTAAELVVFKEWSSSDPAHTEAFARACKLWEAIGPAGDALAGAPQLHRPGQRTSVGRRAFLGGALAASAAGALYVAVHPPLGLWPSLSELAADYRTAPGEQRSIVLSGGSSVEMNTRTSIVVGAPADAVERIKLIGGEAAIATQRENGRSIEVVAADGRIAAVDASFNVRYEGDVVCTTCVAGELDVIQGNGKVRLHPREQVTYSARGLGAVTAVDPAVATAWKQGVLMFQSTPLSEAVAEINRYRSGRIIVTNAALGRRLFNAWFQIANIDSVVAQIQQVFGASVTTLPGDIVLLG